MRPPPNSLRLCERIHNAKNNRLGNVSWLTPRTLLMPEPWPVWGWSGALDLRFADV